jgi:hypothetical protein
MKPGAKMRPDAKRENSFKKAGKVGASDLMIEDNEEGSSAEGTSHQRTESAQTQIDDIKRVQGTRSVNEMDEEWNETNNSELVQNTRVMKLDIDKELVGLLMLELQRISKQAGHEVLNITDAINDALLAYLMHLKAHNFARLN